MLHDFWKNSPTPNIRTNDVFYRRQLSFHAFNAYVLSDSSAFIYTYNETIAKRGSDDVRTMLLDFCVHLSERVQHLDLFCDGCGGQNKNWTVIRFLYYLVHIAERFVTITIHFPVRGHSYMECDMDMSRVDQKAKVELPSEWNQVIQQARKSPKPFNVIPMTGERFYKFGEALKPQFRATCPFPTRPVRILKVSRDKPMLILHRDKWQGEFNTSPVVRGRRKGNKNNLTGPVTLESGYTQPLPLSKPKFQDLQVLKRFISPAKQAFYDELTHDGSVPDDVENIGTLADV